MLVVIFAIELLALDFFLDLLDVRIFGWSALRLIILLGVVDQLEVVLLHVFVDLRYLFHVLC